MSTLPFVHLNLASRHTPGVRRPSVQALVRAATQAGMSAIGLADHHVLSGAVELETACRRAARGGAAAPKPIVGSRLRVPPPDHGGNPWQITLLAENRTGYANLMRLSTAAHADDPAYPVVSAELLAAHAEGLIALFGGSSSRLVALAQDAPLEVERLLTTFGRLFGPDQFFLALARTGPADHVVSDCELIRCARSIGVPIVAVCDPNEPLDPGPVFPSPQEIAGRFSDVPDAVAATAAIAERIHSPVVHLPRTDRRGDDGERVRRMVRDGLTHRYPAMSSGLTARAEAELDLLSRAGQTTRLLVAAELICAARETGIMVGPGRANAPSWLVIYALGLSEVDPVRHQLLAPLPADAADLPPFDLQIDVDSARRSELVHRLQADYGTDRVGEAANDPLGASLIVADHPLAELVPLSGTSADRLVQLQFDAESAAQLGLARIDLFGRDELHAIAITQALIRATRPEFDLSRIPEEPGEMDDLAAAVAVDRPEVADRREELELSRRGTPADSADFPEVAEHLTQTHGVLIYREQAEAVLTAVAGFPPQRAREACRDICAGKAREIGLHYQAFRAAFIARGYTETDAKLIWWHVRSACRANKAHCYARAVQMHRIAYLDSHYPHEWQTGRLLAGVTRY